MMTRITEREQIVIPEAPSGHWIITAPRLKLAIKYGVLGGERTANPSVAFDAYALGRGPKAGIPTIADFAMTVVMNSNVTGADIANLDRWLREPNNAAKLRKLASQFSMFPGLPAIDGRALRLLAELVDEFAPGHAGSPIIRNIGRVKVLKWLSAWAPAHVPMIDRKVEDALQKMLPRRADTYELLSRFRKLVKENHSTLTTLGTWLSKSLNKAGIRNPIPAARILDNLLWCDWWGVPKTDIFRKWIKQSYKNRVCYELRDDGNAAIKTLYDG